MRVHAQGRIWRVPQHYIDMACEAMGGIDLDLSVPPDDALGCPWQGHVFLVPPGYKGLPAAFIAKLLAEIEAGNVPMAVLLTNNSTDTRWFQAAHRASSRLCFVKGRIRFTMPDGSQALPLQGQAAFYFGDQPERFVDTFSRVGRVTRHYPLR